MIVICTDFLSLVTSLISRCWGAIAFYTILPVPGEITIQRIAGLSPWVGVLIGGLVELTGIVCHQWLGFPPFTTGAVMVLAWIAITGGLHLDGAMDTADGLAVMDPDRRLEVMRDSASGAFGVISAISICLIKFTTLVDIDLGLSHGYGLLVIPAIARWGQVMAIRCYPYLRPEGKGAFHKQDIQPQDPWLALLPIALISLGVGGWNLEPWGSLLTLVLGGLIVTIAIGAWFAHRLGGHTGDTYGAIVEWSEVAQLLLFVLLV